MNLFEKLRFLFVLAASPVTLVCCSSHSSLRYVTDLPLKSVELPDMAWEHSPMRAHAQYLLYGANSSRERMNRLGDYYFVEWYDGCPEAPTRIEMLYTQAGTASRVFSRSVNYSSPRSFRGIRRTTFVFNGPERAKKGDILTWRINLYVNEKQVDSHRSYLWSDELPSLQPATLPSSALSLPSPHPPHETTVKDSPPAASTVR